MKKSRIIQGLMRISSLTEDELYELEIGYRTLKVTPDHRFYISRNNEEMWVPTKELKVGDIITIEFFKNTTTVEVVKIPVGNVSVQEAKDLYILKEEKTNEN